LGDSIRFGAGERQGYGNKTAELLGEGFEVFQPAENCRFAKHTLRMLFDYEEKMKGSRIVHFNVGHWDLCELFDDGTFSTEEEYRENVVRIAKILKSRYDKVIFATTTPVRKENKHNKNSTIVRFNKIAVEALEREGVLINDLNALLVGDIERYICSDLIHLTSEGVEICAHAVAEIIKKAGKEITDIFAEIGNDGFRKLEAEIIASVSSENSGAVIATGGGAILRDDNIRALKRNGKIYFLNRPIENIVPTSDRPLSLDREALEARFRERYKRYLSTCDMEIKTVESPMDVANKIKEDFLK
jgi:shikimate kinase